MTEMTFGFIEVLFPFDYLRIVYITPGGNTKTLHIEIYVFHLFCADIQLVVRKPHHATLVYLYLSFTDFFRIAAVGNAHITGESQFYS